MVIVLCVLKSGGIYGPRYARNLRHMLVDKLEEPWEFVVLTDMKVDEGFMTMPLIQNWPRWWSKVEAFRIKSRVIYLDLDTSIFGSLVPLAEAIEDKGSFYMLSPFKESEDWASGIMAWNGDFSFVYDSMTRHLQREIRWDQRYISQRLKEHGVEIGAVQDVMSGIYSYRHHCQKRLPEGARIVCFHGKPKPPTVGWPYWALEENGEGRVQSI